jgi:hypothetical protein
MCSKRMEVYTPPALSVATVKKFIEMEPGRRILLDDGDSRGTFVFATVMGRGYRVGILWDRGYEWSADRLNHGFRILGPLEQLAEVADSWVKET